MSQQRRRQRRLSRVARDIQRDLTDARSGLLGQRAPLVEYYRGYLIGSQHPCSLATYRRALAQYGVRFEGDIAIIPPLAEARRKFEEVHGQQNWREPDHTSLPVDSNKET